VQRKYSIYRDRIPDVFAWLKRIKSEVTDENAWSVCAEQSCRIQDSGLGGECRGSSACDWVGGGTGR
jgi:hypothetical protein